MFSRVFLGLFAILPAYGAELPPVEDFISVEDMKSTGLYKLDEGEREAFRKWLEVFLERDAEFVQRQYRERLGETAGTVKNTGDNMAIQSHIVGEFSGWEGRARFELANGQIWEHRRKDDVFRHRPIENPEVIIRKNLLGFFTMEIPAADVKLPVKRLR